MNLEALARKLYEEHLRFFDIKHSWKWEDMPSMRKEYWFSLARISISSDALSPS